RDHPDPGDRGRGDAAGPWRGAARLSLRERGWRARGEPAPARSVLGSDPRVVTGSATSLQVADATVDLTPPAGSPLGGYLLREGKTATGAHDPLEGSLVWLRDPQGGEVLWLAMDVVCVDEELAARIAAAVGQACGCATDAVLVCASHTHSSAVGWVRGLGPMSPETADGSLRDALVDRLATAARLLPSQLNSCWPVFAEGHAPAAGGNRNVYPDATRDRFPAGSRGRRQSALRPPIAEVPGGGPHRGPGRGRGARGAARGATRDRRATRHGPPRGGDRPDPRSSRPRRGA